MAVRAGCRKPRLEVLTTIQAGDRVLFDSPLGVLSFRLDRPAYVTRSNAWRIVANDGWDVVHVLHDGSLLELAAL